MTMQWITNRPKENLGFIPNFVSDDDPRPAREQFNENYAHGGGWRPQNGFKVVEYNPDITPVLVDGYGDHYVAWAIVRLRDELIVVYPQSYVAIFQLDGSFEVSRMD